MSMTCPRCQRSFPGQQQCVDCGCRLQFQAFALDHTPAPGLDPVQWQHTPWGKIVAGLLLTVGLSYGLQQLCAAGFLVGGEALGAGVWGTLSGLVLLQVLQGLGLLAGGAVTGAGQTRGMLYGAAVGLGSGAMFLLLQGRHGTGTFELVLLAQPVLHAILGMFGGLLGMSIWKPPPTIPLATGAPAPASSRDEGGRLFVGPIHHARVAAGAVIVVAGVVWSHMILDYLLRASNGTMAISSHLQARLIGWEIAALATLVGAGLAGATTANGLKQGLCVGIAAAIVIAGIHAGAARVHLEEAVVLLSCVLTLSLGGGWFGGQLFPPVGPARRRSLSAL